MRRRPVPGGGRTTWTWRRGRLLAAGLVLVALIAVTSVSAFTGSLRVCEDGCRPLSLVDPPVILGVLLALGILLPDVQRLRIGAEGVEIERDTVGEDEDLTGRVGLLERKIELFRDPPGPDTGGDEP